MNFYKYESLGNDFILLDLLGKVEKVTQQKINSNDWSETTQKLCNKNFGIGANGILILKKEKSIIKSLIFNADGSDGGVCFNGIRCIAKHLFDFHNFPKEFNVVMGNKKIQCKINEEITTNVGKAKYVQTKKIKIKNKFYSGHMVDVGNPHFIIFKKTNQQWLCENGNLFENHKTFKNKTNTEFIWQHENKKTFNALVYERGCGITQACGSGAAAIIQTLLKTKQIKLNEKIKIQMLGGTLEIWTDKKETIFQKANAHLIFEGNLKI